MRRFGPVLCLLATPVLAQQSGPPPEVSLVPHARPDTLMDPETQVPAEDPVAKPTVQEDAGTDAQDDSQSDLPSIRETLREDDAEYAACLAALNAHGTVYETAGPVTDDTIEDCGIARPVRVREIVAGVALTPQAIMRCDTARATADWVSSIVTPAANTLPDRGRLSALQHGSAYICRTRNNAPGGKISEHGFGNAIDIMAFEFEEGAPIKVEPREREGTREEAFQRAVRAGSCLYFTTVLGPGADASHADHLHMDIKARNGGYRLCQ